MIKELQTCTFIILFSFLVSEEKNPELREVTRFIPVITQPLSGRVKPGGKSYLPSLGPLHSPFAHHAALTLPQTELASTEGGAGPAGCGSGKLNWERALQSLLICSHRSSVLTQLPTSPQGIGLQGSMPLALS